MLDDYKSLPFIVGVGILLLVPFGVGGLIYSTLNGDNAANQTKTFDSPASNTDSGLAREKNISSVPPLSSESSRGTGDNSDLSQGIPIGKYSNPPTEIKSFGTDMPDSSRPVDNFGSSVERNPLNQQHTNRLIPDYSVPSSSNDFNRTEDNSLIEPIEEEKLVEIPPSNDQELINDQETIPLSPVTEPFLPR